VVFNLNMAEEKVIKLNESINFAKNPKIVANSVEDDQRKVLNNEIDKLEAGQVIVLVNDYQSN
ncbi:hypothetical protein, partial [Clostridium perfringens]